MLISLLIGFIQSELPAWESKEVAAFAADYHRRRGNMPTAAADPAIKAAMGVLVDMAERRWRTDPRSTTKTVEKWLRPFQLAIGANLNDPAPIDQFDYSEMHIQKVGPYRFITVLMGAATSTRAFTSDWKPIKLPTEFDWNSPWCLWFHDLPGGPILGAGDSIQGAGIAEGVRLVWLKPHGSALKRVEEFTGGSTLDYEQPIIRGDEVTIRTQDNPVSFAGWPSELLFERVTTWRCKSGKPEVKRIRLLQPEMRFVDKVLARALHTKRGTRLQKRICQIRYGPNGYDPIEVGSWKILKLGGGVNRVWLDDMAFDLKKTGPTYRLLRVFGKTSRSKA